MKNKITQAFARLERIPLLGICARALGKCWRLLSHNFGLKMLSLLIAILMWNFVITSDTTITRTKTVSDLNAYITGKNTLTSANGFALSEDPSELLSDISVTVEVSQADFSNVTQDNVQVTLDLSNVRREGEQELALKATTSYGRVVKITPSSIPVSIEMADSRVIPVNVQTSGTPESDRWYKINRSNPTTLTIKGPASVVQEIASAYVYIDVTGARSSFTSAEQFVLLDSEGNEVPQEMLERSASSISVSVDVYPTKEIAIDTSLDSVITGQPAQGYQVESVSIQPGTLTVAGEQELLDSIDSLLIEPISVEGASQSFSVRAKVSALSAFKSVSAEEVYVNVSIEEEMIGAWIEDVKISYANKGEGLTLEQPQSVVRVYVTGPRSAIEELQQVGFAATVDLSGLQAGSYWLSMAFPEETYPEVRFTPEAAEIQVVLTDGGQSAP